MAEHLEKCFNYGGIIGNNMRGIIKNCFAYGVNVNGTSGVGAIVGIDDTGTFVSNYYHGCTVNNKTSDIGINYKDQKGASIVYALNLPPIVTASTAAVTHKGTNYYTEGTAVTLSYESAPPGFQEPFLGYSLNGTPLEGDTFTMPANDVTVIARWSVADYTSGHAGSALDPYIIYNCDQLNLLANHVNSGDDYNNKFIKLGADITYDGTENNYIPIGTESNPFNGTFNGDGHTVRGIRIYKGGVSNDDNNQGLFGYVYNGTVKDVTLSDCDIIGYRCVGGIVGFIEDGTIIDCCVESTVTIGTDANYAQNHGGIVGRMESQGTVSGCISAANVADNGNDGCDDYGGIVGFVNSNKVLISNNIAVGATIGGGNGHRGAIVGGNKFDNLANNYHYDCTVGGSTTNVGSGSGDVTDGDGALHTDGTPLLDTYRNDYVLNAYNGVANQNYTLAGRTLYKDGAWNTLCLPFDVSITSGPLAGDDVKAMTLDADNSGLSGSTLTLNFTAVSPSGEQGGLIPAGTPFIIKWGTPDSHPASDLENPVFPGVTIDNSASTEVSFTGGTFKGTYNAMTFTDENKSILFLGYDAQDTEHHSKLYYPESGARIYAFRSYFQLDNPNAVKSFILNFGDDDVTGIAHETYGPHETHEQGAWFDMSGRKLSQQPTKPGLYIHHGSKVVIK